MTRVVLASRNAGKARELQALLAVPGLSLVLMSEVVPAAFDVEETGATFEENAWLKALALCAQTGLMSVADDSGLEVDALGGRPGVHSARFARLGATDEENNARLLRELVGVADEGRTARFCCVLSLALPGVGGPTRAFACSGALEGKILTAPRGVHGFGYDPLFQPLELTGADGLGPTTAEISTAEKNRISHRARAARELSPVLSRKVAQANFLACSARKSRPA